MTLRRRVDGCLSLSWTAPAVTQPSVNPRVHIYTQYFAQVVETRVPFRYHLSVPGVPERSFGLPAVLQIHRVRPILLAYEARGRVFESPRAYQPIQDE